MSAWTWILIGVILGAIELGTTTFVLMWIAIAALCTGFISFLWPNFTVQVSLFAVLSIALLLLTRPLSKRLRNRKTTYVSNVGRLVGEQGLVTERMADGQPGTVRVGSEVWTARADPLDDVIESGEWVAVIAAESATLRVRKLGG